MGSNDTQTDGKVAANAEYQKVLATVMSLATAALLFPVVFLREIAGAKEGEPLLPLFRPIYYWSAASLILSIAASVLFTYISAKWLKNAHGGSTWLSPHALERWLDSSFWVAVLLFLIGLTLLVCFLGSAKVET